MSQMNVVRTFTVNGHTRPFCFGLLAERAAEEVSGAPWAYFLTTPSFTVSQMQVLTFAALEFFRFKAGQDMSDITKRFMNWSCDPNREIPRTFSEEYNQFRYFLDKLLVETFPEALEMRAAYQLAAAKLKTQGTKMISRPPESENSDATTPTSTETNTSSPTSLDSSGSTDAAPTESEPSETSGSTTAPT